jgi:tRNA threonylcarbamoyladenosine biosynthesis protein TsaB
MTPTVLLAIDTSTEFCSVALLSAAPEAGDAAVTHLWTRHEQTGAVSSARVLPAVRELLDEAGLPLSACQAIAFGAGPGSFTGLRTATGVAQGLAFGCGRPVLPVSTLMVCAEAARLAALARGEAAPVRVLVALDARMDEVYWADYAWDEAMGDWQVLQPAALAVPEAVPVPDQPFVLAGNAAAVFGARLTCFASAAQVEADALPHAAPLAQLALRAWRAGRAVPPEQAMPEYIRDKVAQTTAEREAARAAVVGGAQ